MAVKARANLADAYLAGANLADAYLADAYLAGANLADAYLAGANLADETITIQPIKISGLTWPVLITDGYLRIGCQRHTHEQWQNFTDDEIRAMETGARLFWKSWKEPLMIMCKNHAEKVKK
jgi:hypothetical protein